MMKTTIHRIVLFVLLSVTVYAANGGQNGHFGQGNGSGQKGGQADPDLGHIGRLNETEPDPAAERIKDLCRNSKLSDEYIDQLLSPIRAAHAESLPAENIVLKIEEGLAKQVDPSLIAKAAEARLDYLRLAGNLLRSVRHGRGGGLFRLTGRVALILEGGLSAELIGNTLKHSNRGGPGRLIRVIDAGAELHQAGFSEEQTQQIMNDCVDRDLNGVEISRALDFLLSEHAKGRDFQSIYQQLWIQPD